MSIGRWADKETGTNKYYSAIKGINYTHNEMEESQNHNAEWNAGQKQYIP